MAIYEVLSDQTAKAALDEMGGLEYLVLLKDSRVMEDNIKIYCEKVKQAYVRRTLFDICESGKELMLSSSSEKLNPSELVSSIENKLGDLSIQMSTTSEVYKMGEETDEVLAAREASPETIPGLEVGFTEMDKLTNGLMPGDLLVLAAESKTGKSAMLTNWAANLAILGKVPVLYIDTEMNHREQEDRILSRLSQVPHNEVVSGMYVLDSAFGKADDKIARIKAARDKLKLGNYFHIQMTQFSIEKVTAIARKFQIQHGIQALFFDYIKVPSGDMSSLNKMQEYQALGFFTSGLKDIASTLSIPVVTAAQTNRTNLGEVDKDASSIGGSYRILQLATKLLFLVNKSDKQISESGIDNGNQVLSIKYQRNGASDCDPINIMFYKNILFQKEAH